MVRKDAPPAWLNAAVCGCRFVTVIAVLSRCHGLWISLCQDGLNVAQGGRHPCDPFHVGLGELVQINFMRKGTVRHLRGQAVGGLQLIDRAMYHRAKVSGLTAMTTARWHQHRHTRVMHHHQCPHDVVQVRPMIPAVPPGDGHALYRGCFIAVVAPIDMNTGALDMGQAGARAKRTAA